MEKYGNVIEVAKIDASITGDLAGVSFAVIMFLLQAYSDRLTKRGVETSVDIDNYIDTQISNIIALFFSSFINSIISSVIYAFVVFEEKINDRANICFNAAAFCFAMSG